MSVTLTRSTSSYDAATDTLTVTSSTITGTAIKVRGNPVRYQALGVVEAEAPTLLFVPTTYGQTPDPGDTIVWSSLTYTVRDVDSLAPDGVTIQSRIIISR